MGRKTSDGKSVTVAVPAVTTITQGKFVLLDGVLGIAVQGIQTDAAGDVISYNGNSVTAGLVNPEITLNIEHAEYETSQIDAADAFAKGDRVYWDAGSLRFTTVAGDGIYCGVVTEVKDANGVIWFLFAPQQPALRQSATVAAVAAADGAAAAGVNPTKAEYDVVVTLANENKAKINAVLVALKAAGLMA
ncbi:MAG: DUF2190 family protein [Bacillota bacterium]